MFSFVNSRKQFDSIPCHSVKERWEILNFKMATGCIHALSINNPDIAIPWIKDTDRFFESYVYLKRDNTGNILFRIFIHFANGAWEECLSLIDKIEINITTASTSATLLNIKLICIYEQNDHYYFNSLINKHTSKKRKSGLKTSNCTKLNDCVFYVLHSIAQRNNNIEECFIKVLKSFEPIDWKTRYFIHWIASALLNGDDYRSFLEKNACQHYDFKTLKATTTSNNNVIDYYTHMTK